MMTSARFLAVIKMGKQAMGGAARFLLLSRRTRAAFPQLCLLRAALPVVSRFQAAPVG
jgi:hypothetical protein